MNNYMDQSGKNPNTMHDDDRLADFTNQVLDGRLEQAESNVTDELLALEETILRLKQSLPSAPLDQAAIKQMQVRLKARIRREEQQTRQPFWKRWLEPQFRPQLGMAFAAVALLIVFVVISPSLVSGGSTVTGTALTPSRNIVVVAILAGIILFLLRIKRPK